MTVAVLFARADSVYKTMPECDVYDIERDARTWPGGCQVVAHPPCRAWSRLRKFAKPRKGERLLATGAVRLVRQWGGVLEHPAGSRLWPRVGLPAPGAPKDKYGGWTLGIYQGWWGHPADKPTLLYIVGLEPRELAPLPFRMGRASKCVTNSRTLRRGDPGFRTECTKAEREHTPPALARWLVDLAARCAVKAEAAA